MNQVAFNILKKAYSQYQNFGSLRHSIILSGNTDDILNSIQALQKEGYIERIVQTELEIAFDLSTIGIEYMASNQEAFYAPFSFACSPQSFALYCTYRPPPGSSIKRGEIYESI